MTASWSAAASNPSPDGRRSAPRRASHDRSSTAKRGPAHPADPRRHRYLSPGDGPGAAARRARRSSESP
ncbi:hypothetical protein ACFPM0_11990 [Pseudonocardia sulfidoxydans]|uniref:hypothetical protein n=1 Tax=Pseudonocardia sulfidoxydans TaxID=54011 RepID=UPI00361452C6